jgi:hypothetical protein
MGSPCLAEKKRIMAPDEATFGGYFVAMQQQFERGQQQG